MAVTALDAEKIVVARLANDDSEPAVVRVEDAGQAWRVFYNSRAFVETRAMTHALAGNLPMLVNKQAGAVAMDTDWAS